jgi:hypothetical protein
MKTYFGISRDHSGSMRSIAPAAARDYNALIESIKTESLKTGQDTIVSVVKCGTTYEAIVKREVVNSNVNALQPVAVRDYDTDGRATPLFDSVGELIDIMSNVPDAHDPNVAFVIMVVTDGGENSSQRWKNILAAKIQELQASDRWTFIFRVPRGYGHHLTTLGVPEGNILEWDQTTKGVEVASQHTTQAMSQFYAARSTGQTSTKRFYADLSKVTVNEVKAVLKDISTEVNLWPVAASEEGDAIRDFVEKRLHGGKLLKGAAFYQLTKGEDKVGAKKKIIIRDKKSNALYFGEAARDLLGIPRNVDIKLSPKLLGEYDVFIQSTSVNRKMKANTQVVYWPDVGVKYKEGPSA